MRGKTRKSNRGQENKSCISLTDSVCLQRRSGVDLSIRKGKAFRDSTMLIKYQFHIYQIMSACNLIFVNIRRNRLSCCSRTSLDAIRLMTFIAGDAVFNFAT